MLKLKRKTMSRKIELCIAVRYLISLYVNKNDKYDSVLDKIYHVCGWNR